MSPEETYQLSKRLWQQITVQSLAGKMAAVKKEPGRIWEQMVNNEVVAKSIVSGGYPALERVPHKAGSLHLPGRNLSLTVDADPQAEISSKETLAENLTSLTLSMVPRLFLKSASEKRN
ncbi:hypothetical protein DMI69_25630 [Escherichia coli]|nr:hypothetical protein [Escherichia coli]